MSTQGHRIEVTPGSDEVVVQVNDTIIATSTRPLVLTETGCPARFYLPVDDVRTDLLTPSSTTSHCPFKGDAVYWSVNTGAGLVEDVVWSYPDSKIKEISGLLAFWTEKPDVALRVNGRSEG